MPDENPTGWSSDSEYGSSEDDKLEILQEIESDTEQERRETIRRTKELFTGVCEPSQPFEGSAYNYQPPL